MLPSPHLLLPVLTDLQTGASLFRQECFCEKSEVERKFDILQEIAFIFVTQQLEPQAACCFFSTQKSSALCSTLPHVYSVSVCPVLYVSGSRMTPVVLMAWKNAPQNVLSFCSFIALLCYPRQMKMCYSGFHSRKFRQLFTVQKLTF